MFVLVYENVMLSMLMWTGISVGIAANHSDFGGILPLFTQYSAIPIRMTKFRQNLKKFGNAITMDKDYACARHCIR